MKNRPKPPKPISRMGRGGREYVRKKIHYDRKRIHKYIYESSSCE